MIAIPQSLNRSAVLLVDDEPGMRTALRANFLRSGWEVETASGVLDATLAVQRRPFDLVITDVRMADGDGLAVLDSAASRHRGKAGALT